MTHQINIICKIYIDKKPRILEGIYTLAKCRIFLDDNARADATSQ